MAATQSEQEKIDVLVKAIKERRKVSFKYDFQKKYPGERTGDPYMLYRPHRPKVPTLTLLQTGGDTSKPADLPGWRNFTVQGIENLTILPESFQVDNNKWGPGKQYGWQVIAEV